MQQRKGNDKAAGNMLSFAPTPIFSGAWDHHRPSIPSPLSSSPIRASSPLSPIHENTLSQRQTQSSPIQPPKFKYAARPTRPNPVVRRREVAQESRRRTFLQSVRQKSDDRAWQRRDIEGQFLKTSWLDDRGRLARDAPDFTEADIDDAMAFHEEVEQPHEDDMVMETNPEDEELEAMLESYEEQQHAPSQRPPSPTLSDEEYDDIFAELLSQEQSQPEFSQNSTDHMDMS
ncbi:hypothetical protein VFPFJ_09369 [Purpureocillium lilacinum]|uniref:Uncharacterized protein n=3 Tax=Purpureocillium lilacinum TaxID=33203 RepID=A0A179GSK4_PURLI|nr:hypothetical protein VFPFJ_09369 [Purpureocillium lilacinum]OAQ75286.1 hypothetical protein VFPBJ_09261 [Purpureocillium lilacinum]OAQ80916.1 hypothetical protein VFPFJ_09369 [Purpureocillium lilacinum]GJN86478.1 hypothetical protein PLIIFM63780_010058 [Purpureocillium lilacinum]